MLFDEVFALHGIRTGRVGFRINQLPIVGSFGAFGGWMSGNRRSIQFPLFILTTSIFLNEGGVEE